MISLDLRSHPIDPLRLCVLDLDVDERHALRGPPYFRAKRAALAILIWSSMAPAQVRTGAARAPSSLDERIS